MTSSESGAISREELRANNQKMKERRQRQKCADHPTDVEVEQVHRVGKRIKGWGVGEIRGTHRHSGVIGERDNSNEGSEVKQSCNEVESA